MSSKRRTKEIETLIHRLGPDLAYKVEPPSGRSSHFRCTIFLNGHSQTFFFSATPSDHQGDRRKLAAIRRWCSNPAIVPYVRDIG